MSSSQSGRFTPPPLPPSHSFASSSPRPVLMFSHYRIYGGARAFDASKTADRTNLKAVALNCGSRVETAAAFYLPLPKVTRALELLQRGEKVSTPRGCLMVRCCSIAPPEAGVPAAAARLFVSPSSILPKTPQQGLPASSTMTNTVTSHTCIRSPCARPRRVRRLPGEHSTGVLRTAVMSKCVSCQVSFLLLYRQLSENFRPPAHNHDHNYNHHTNICMLFVHHAHTAAHPPRAGYPGHNPGRPQAHGVRRGPPPGSAARHGGPPPGGVPERDRRPLGGRGPAQGPRGRCAGARGRGGPHGACLPYLAVPRPCPACRASQEPNGC